MKRLLRIFVFCIFFAGFATVIFSQESEDENSSEIFEQENDTEIFEQENVSEEKKFPKNAFSAGVIYLGLGLEYERLITPAIGVAGTILVYHVGGLEGVWALAIQGRIYPLHFLLDVTAHG